MNPAIRLMVADGGMEKVTRRVQAAADAATFSLVIPRDDSEAALLDVVGGADAIFCYQAEIPGSVIRAGSGLRLIQKHGQNCRSIDVATATGCGVKVATLPLMRNVTVAEHALALMLACARKVIPGHLAVTGASYLQSGPEPMQTTQSDYRSNWPGISGVTELFRSTVGIIGMGDIGMEIAARCKAFGMSVCYHQRTRHPAAVERALDIDYRGFDELLETADYVVLVIPHTPQTEGMINAQALARMKPTASLINVGRGGLIDESALADALRDGRIAMAGLDVYRMEPLPAASPLRSLPNVVLLPHTGGGSYRSWEVDLPASLGNIRKFFAGEGAAGIINA